jgi:transposase InsO family protein
MDDTSRLIAHSAFCFSETAIDIEGVLKQALLKRGVPKMLIVDNGAAYRAATLQGIPGGHANSSGHGHFKLLYMNGPLCATFFERVDEQDGCISIFDLFTACYTVGHYEIR